MQQPLVLFILSFFCSFQDMSEDICGVGLSAFARCCEIIISCNESSFIFIYQCNIVSGSEVYEPAIVLFFIYPDRFSVIEAHHVHQSIFAVICVIGIVGYAIYFPLALTYTSGTDCPSPISML